jgi:ribonuclease VapC
VIAVDASALLAILLQEPEAPEFRALLDAAAGGLISPVNYWEVMARAGSAKGDEGRAAAEALLAAFSIEIAPVTTEQARLAVEAHRKFGRGTKAALNLGDCFAYALAVVEGDGLLFKGGDFPLTDIAPLYQP